MTDDENALRRSLELQSGAVPVMVSAIALRGLLAEVERLRAELEIERMRLAACGVVAMANTADSAAAARQMLPEYRSASLQDVERAVDEQMKLRSELAEASKDAARYRWLRGDSCMDHSARWTQWEVRRWNAPIWTDDLRRADLDAAIDAAMRKDSKHG